MSGVGEAEIGGLRASRTGRLGKEHPLAKLARPGSPGRARWQAGGAARRRARGAPKWRN